MFKKLNEHGRINKRTVCPYRMQRPLTSSCRHMGEQHLSEFSCAGARAVDMDEQRGVSIGKEILERMSKEQY